MEGSCCGLIPDGNLLTTWHKDANHKWPQVSQPLGRYRPREHLLGYNIEFCSYNFIMQFVREERFQLIKRHVKGSGQDLFEGSITESCISLEGLRKTMKNLGQHCQYPSWDSKWALLFIKDSEGLLLSENCLVCLNYDCTKRSEIPTQLFKNSGDFT